ncbi:MAG: hypothetical protein ACLR6B_15980 [Blautia sp.]
MFHKGGAADFNTFFNSFSIGKWRKYTVLETVSLSLKLQGSFYGLSETSCVKQRSG